jgi:hypothetical protein
MNKLENSTPDAETVLSEETLQAVTGGRVNLFASLDSVLRQYRELNISSIQRAVFNRGSLISISPTN